MQSKAKCWSNNNMLAVETLALQTGTLTFHKIKQVLFILKKTSSDK